MFKIDTEIEIEGTAQEVFIIFTNTDNYSKWNPFFKSIKGQMNEGSVIEIFMQPAGEKGMTIIRKITRYHPYTELCWAGALIHKSLFAGEYSIKIEELKDNRVKFKHCEEFRGLLIPLLKTKLNKEIRKGFEEMNKALKECVEKEKLT